MTNKELDNKINQVLSGWNAPTTKSKEEIWDTVSEQIKYDKPPIYKLNNWRWLAAASIFVIAVSMGVYKTAEVKVISNQQSTNFTLPDGSLVALNVRSSASYNKITWLFKRSVSLSGEAFFKVTKGEKFKVITRNGVVGVLGTSFNVLARNNTFNVECFTGRVEVNNKINKTVITKGEMVRQSNGFELIKEQKNQLSKTPRWTTGDYSYKNEELATVLNDIATHFNISLQANKKIGKLTFTGSWKTTMTLDEVLKIVCLPFDLESINTKDGAFKIQMIEK